MILVIAGTILQGHLGTKEVQEKIFRSFFVYWQPNNFQIKIPVFPGGYLLGGFFVINLACSMILNAKIFLEKLGFFLIHFGIIFLLLGEALGGILSSETIFPIKVNHKKNYSIDLKKTELAITNNSSIESEIIFPDKQVITGRILTHSKLPFSLLVKKRIDNALINEKESFDQISKINIATEGIGSKLSVAQIPISYKDNELNNMAAWIEIIDKENKIIGTWLLSNAIEQEQFFIYQDLRYNFIIRPKRQYFPFWIELLEFKHEKYPGTYISKDFSSHVMIYSNEGMPLRSAFITMNNPLKYQGLTLYQSGFGSDDMKSILKIVKNPTSAMPYLFSCLVISGFIYQFMFRFFCRNGIPKPL